MIWLEPGTSWWPLDSPDVNEEVSREAEERRVFCVRSDDAEAATAWTPASGRHGPLTVAVLGSRDPIRSAAVRDEIVNRLRSGEIAAPKDRVRVPGVVLVGGGPGDPDLITVAGRRALQEADVVVADRLAPRDLLAELAPDVELIDATKLPRGRSANQADINAVMIELALAGKNVVRFKGGDSFVFGRGFEELLACTAAGVPCRMFPGVSSSLAAPALAGVPLTHRGVAHDFTVVSGHLPPGHPDSLVEWPALARLRGTLVLLMAIGNLEAISLALTANGKDQKTPVAVVQNGSPSSQRVLFSTLAAVAAEVATHSVRPPAVVVIGDVVAVADSVSATRRNGATREGGQSMMTSG
ncbi:MAG: uroporphyrinogen-III C-methyltransferase [Nocardioidaceae bacterium]